ncbi:hypothetical protein [Asticcacaulis excentricus]|uniref:Uncharacterized protein n=1 Tax=Asticcacaulis excentricus TaxID=78587 RepID=A0A3G9G746_9CAUL|nr:hypothetical protein [Asticcacaulis excentricus]BBF82607.1 hypothetical protein EM6_3248 [Asticcacaulis excentricus]
MLAFHLRSLRATASFWPLLPAALLLAPAVAAHAQTQPAIEETQEVFSPGD